MNAKRLFIEFLNDRAIVDPFIHNMIKDGSYNAVSDLFDQESPESYVDAAFIWKDETPEGEDFWYDLDTKWRRVLKQHERPFDPNVHDDMRHYQSLPPCVVGRIPTPTIMGVDLAEKELEPGPNYAQRLCDREDKKRGVRCYGK